MSGIGEAASIAGLVTIAGQCVKQISKLYSFVRDFQNVVPQTTSLFNELELLQQCLSQIQTVASRALAVNCDFSRSVDALFGAVDRCHGSIIQIEDQLRAVYPGKKNMVWNRLKVTAARDFFARFQAQISAQKLDLILRLDALSCELDLRTYDGVELLTASSHMTEKKFCDMAQAFDRRHDLSERHLQTLDARLQVMQNMLQQSISRNQRGSPKSCIRVAKSRQSYRVSLRPKALKTSETQTSSSPPFIQPFQVISPALLMYEKDGVLQRQLIPLECTEFNGLDDALKIQMIEYLQSLRLLIWLLGRNNILTTNPAKLGIPSRSVFTMQAGMISSWQFSTALQNLTSSLGGLTISHSSLNRLPWLRYRSWFQYVLDMTPEQPENGEEVMALVIKNWQNFPPPDDGQGFYNLAVPGRLLEDPDIQKVRSLYSRGSKNYSRQNPCREYLECPCQGYTNRPAHSAFSKDHRHLGRHNTTHHNASGPVNYKDKLEPQTALLSSELKIQPEKSKYDLRGANNDPPNAPENDKQQGNQAKPRSINVSPQDGQNSNANQQPSLDNLNDPCPTNKDIKKHKSSWKERFVKK
ncbi:MAG: hypothetical protein Q9167_004511 [Letrouitia subvulpina]